MNASTNQKIAKQKTNKLSCINQIIIKNRNGRRCHCLNIKKMNR